MKKDVRQLKSLEDTEQFAQEILKLHKPGQVILLKGELGSGKTTFTQYFAKALGIKNRITSPSFLIMKVYPCEYKTIKQLVHIDLYRLKKIDNFGLDEYLNKESLVVIEWPEKIEKQIPKSRIEINFKIIDQDKRKISIINT